MQKRRINKKRMITVLSLFSMIVLLTAYALIMAFNSDKNKTGQNTPNTTQTQQPTETPTPAPTETPEVTPGPAGTENPDSTGTPADDPAETGKPQELIIRTDYENFQPNEAGGSCQLVLGFALLSAPLFGQGSYSKSIISYGSKCPCQQSYFSAIQQCYVMYQLS